MIRPVDQYASAIRSGRLDYRLERWYGPDALEAQKNRYVGLLDQLANAFGASSAIMVSAPGRTELGGNHTDHNHGRVLTASVHLDLAASASPTERPVVTVQSQGFAKPIEVDFSDISPREDEKNSSESLIRGVAAGFAKAGLKTGGFNACVHGAVPVGTGLSSSAAFEVLIGSIFNHLFNDGAADDVFLARVGREAEVSYFGKPCGLMDQLASSVGGVLHIDFNDPASPAIERVETGFIRYGYRLVVVNTGGSHADLTHEYAAVPHEMGLVATHFDKTFLRGLTTEELFEAVPNLRPQTGDRAVLRALHFIEESDRVAKQVKALKENRFDDYLKLVAESGDSSWRLLQDCSVASMPSEQGIPLALALTERFLVNDGACRVHGGGFAGTIQAYIPDGRIDEYTKFMEAVFGAGSVIPLRVRPDGNSVLNMEK